MSSAYSRVHLRWCDAESWCLSYVYLRCESRDDQAILMARSISMARCRLFIGLFVMVNGGLRIKDEREPMNGYLPPVAFPSVEDYSEQMPEGECAMHEHGESFQLLAFVHVVLLVKKDVKVRLSLIIPLGLFRSRVIHTLSFMSARNCYNSVVLYNSLKDT